MPKKETITGWNNQESLTAIRVNFLKPKQKETDTAHDSNDRIARKDGIDEYEVSNQKLANDESLVANAQVGAFAVDGIQGGADDVNERESQDIRLSMAHPSQDLTSVTVTSARLVDDVIVKATPLEDSLFDNNVSNKEKPKKGSILKYRLIAIGSLLLLAGIIIPAIILTRKSSIDSPNGDTEKIAPDSDSSENAFLDNLKPLLTNSSRQELELPYSVQSLALNWLLNSSNFNEYSFDRKVQRYAMAAFFFATGGRLWNVNQGWLTDNDECLWYQGWSESFCVSGNLRVLSLKDNALNGFIPDEIGLLTSLSYLTLWSNELRRSIPSSIGSLQDLTWFELGINELTGNIPSSIGLLTKLTRFDLYMNSFRGIIPISIKSMRNMTHFSVASNTLSGFIPSEIGLFTKLVYLDLWGNSFRGSIPSEIGQCTGLTYLHVASNNLIGSIPSEMGALSELEQLVISDNNLIGSIPESLCNQVYDLC